MAAPLSQSAPGDAHRLRARRIGIDTSQESVIYMRRDCPISRSEGFVAHTRVEVRCGRHTIVATLNVITDSLIGCDEAGLSESAWARLHACDGAVLHVRHAPPVASLAYVRAKLHGHALDGQGYDAVIRDIVAGRYSDIHLSAFIAACAATRMERAEMYDLTSAMIDAGERIDWGRTPVVDKHSVGGIPGNRTTPIIVSICAAAGLTMPKTSSRAITSPAGTADTMETLAPVDLSVAAMRRVVEKEGGCIVWGGSVRLSPADDILIRVERALDIDSEGQLVASVLSKKAAAGSTHLVLDLPMGPRAKVRGRAAAEALAGDLTAVAEKLGIRARAVITDGTQPVGRGIGPALEARDVVAVLRNEAGPPADLGERAVRLAGVLFELAGTAGAGMGAGLARAILADGRAWAKFRAICEAQGGMREPPAAHHTRPVLATAAGRISAVDNRKLAQVAKLAGAPAAPAAGLALHMALGARVEKDAPLYTIHAETPGELDYAFDFAAEQTGIVTIDADP